MKFMMLNLIKNNFDYLDASVEQARPVYELYARTQDAWEAMYADCAAAKTSIDFEQYIILNDDTGMKFMDIFADKARAGVKVSLLLDRVGCRQVFDCPQVHTIREHGGKVAFYNAIGWLNLFSPSSWFPRNHVKSLLIDRQVSYIGGVCLAAEMAEWRDLHVRLTGEPMQQMANSLAAIPATASPHFEYLVSRPFHLKNPIYEELLAQIRTAKNYVHIVTPYFLAPRRLRRELFKAARRGVEVSVVIAGKSDVPMAKYVSQSYFPRMIRRGLNIWSYEPTILHGKYMIVDGEWGMVGSTNMDYLSLLRNREANLTVHKHDLVDALEEQFQDVKKHAHKLSPDFWKSVPLPLRLAGYLGRYMKKIM
jgi:cardiolipin synthase